MKDQTNPSIENVRGLTTRLASRAGEPDVRLLYGMLLLHSLISLLAANSSLFLSGIMSLILSVTFNLLFSLKARAWLLGAIVGLGGATYLLIGGFAVFVLLGAVISVLGQSRKTTQVPSLLPAAAILALFGFVCLTDLTTNVPTSMWGVVYCIGGCFYLAINSPIRERALVAQNVLNATGIVASTGVYLSLLLRINFVIISNSPSSSGRFEDGSFRASGFEFAPNAAAICISAALTIRLVLHFLNAETTKLKPGYFWALNIFMAGALLATGSRASLLAVGVASAFVILMRSFSRRGPKIAGFTAVFLVMSAAVAVYGSISGRSFDLLNSQDGSAVYRRQVQTALWARFSEFQITGVGFQSGSAIAENGVSIGVSNIDNGWLASILAFGLGFAACLLLSLLTLFIFNAKRAFLPLVAGLSWLAVVSVSENVWVLANQGASCILLVAGISSANTMHGMSKRLDQ